MSNKPTPDADDAPTTVTPRPASVAEATQETPSQAAAKKAEAKKQRKKRRARLTQKDLPQRLGRYTLVERLGIGGMAEVFRAQQDGVAGFQKTVVIKRILPHLAVDPRFVEMFFREAKVAADLSHPNIIQIHELGEDDGTYFIVMEYLRGLSLFQLARRAWRAERSIPMELAVYAVADAAQGLHFAFERKDETGRPMNLIHRDVSPDNLMITTQAVTKVLDFGIAKAENTENLTKTGEMKGKIPYMPRELLEPGGTLDHRSDLYSLGITLYWLLTGHRPFRGETDLAVMQAIVAGNPKRPSEWNGAIPPALEDLTLALLARDQEDRPTSGAEVANELLGMVSAQRDLVAQFVRERTEEEPLAPGERPKATSGFLPSVPITGTLAAAQHRRPSAGVVGLDIDIETIGSAPKPNLAVMSDEDAPGAVPAAIPFDDNPTLQVPEPLTLKTAPETPESRASDSGEQVGSPAAEGAGLAGPGLTESAPITRSGKHTHESEQDQQLEQLEQLVELPKRKMPLAAGLGLVGALVVGAVLFVALGEEEPGPAQTTAVAGAETESAPVSGTESVPGSETDAVPGSETEPVPGSETEPGPGSESEPLAGSETEPATESGSESGSEPALESKPKPKPKVKPKRSTKARTIKLTAKAPAHIKWLNARGKSLGRGSTSLTVPSTTGSLTALDVKKGVRSKVSVKGGKVDYASVPTGTMILRAFPFADMVTLGSQKLGPAPLKPQKLKVGRYTVKVTKGKKTITKQVKIEAGRSAIVKVNFGG